IVCGHEDHQGALDSRSDAAMRWRAVGQRVKKETKASLSILLIHAQSLENKCLNIATMNSDRTAGHFDSVNHRVVRFGAEPGKQLRFTVYGTFQRRYVFVQRRRERMMHRVIAAIIFVKLEHGKLSHPQRREDVWAN